jgi:hypothetical protein
LHQQTFFSSLSNNGTRGYIEVWSILSEILRCFRHSTGAYTNTLNDRKADSVPLLSCLFILKIFQIGEYVTSYSTFKNCIHVVK